MSYSSHEDIKWLNNNDSGTPVKCAVCGEYMLKGMSFEDPKTREFYHPDCAGVWQCHECGGWTEETKSLKVCSHCGAAQ